MAEPLRFEQRMSDQEALMWSLELEPVLRSSFANVTLLDRPVDVGRFRDRMARAVETVPRLRQRVGAPGPGLAPPAWLDDPFFDLDFHIRTVALPSPSTERELLDLAAVTSGDPFDRARPLWQFTVVEGLADGRGAIIQKLHHSITDGEGGIRLSAAFVDLERDATEPMALGEPPPPPGQRSPGQGSPGQKSPSRAVRDGLHAGVGVPLELARQAVAGTFETLVNPAGAPQRAGDAVETARSLVRQLAVVEPARSPLWTERSLRRRLEILSVPLDEAKGVADRLGGTVNDWFVTAAAGAAGAYHRRAGVPVDDLRMAMPVSTRRNGSDNAGGSNRFAPTRTIVPVGVTDPVARFDAVRDVLARSRKERGIKSVGRLAGVLSVLPVTVLAKLARQQVGTVDFTTSNVRGAPFPLYIAGARIEANYPIGPLAGTAFNLTTMSSDGDLDMGCLIDVAAVTEPDVLKRCLVEAFHELRIARR